MGDFDLAPPPMPGEHVEEKKGFLKKLFSKKQEPTLSTQQPEQLQVASAPTPNLDDIKRKLGIFDKNSTSSNETQRINQNTNTVEIILPTEESQTIPEPALQVKINDWSQDAPTTEPATKNSTIWARPNNTISIPVPPLAEKSYTAKSTTPEFTEDTSSKRQNSQAIEAIPEHHALIEQHLASLDREHEKIEKRLNEISAETPTVSDWSMQAQEITPDQYFLLRNGQPLKSIAELCDALTFIDDITFEHHVNEYRNDFANWIRDVIKNPTLADKVLAANTRTGMKKILLDQKQTALKTIEKEQKQIQKTIVKRKEAVQELLGTEKKLSILQQQLRKRTEELIGERKKYAELIKKKINSEVAKKIAEESQKIKQATADMQHATQEYEARTQSLHPKEMQIAEGEKRILLEQSKLRKEKGDLQEQRREIEPLLQKSVTIKKDLEELKKLSEKNEKLVKEVKTREDNITRIEDAVHAKEKKLAADLTKNNALHAELTTLKSEIAKRKEELQNIEISSKKISAEAKSRRDDALTIERASRERITADTKRLQALKNEIEKTLGKVKDEKTRVSRAVSLRKKYDDAIVETKKDVVKERERMENESYASLLKEKEDTTPIGQPENLTTKDVLKIKHTELYEKIMSCRQALEIKDISKAKQIYNELRDAYAKADLGLQERETLYADVRELYDDIHLMMLG